MKKYYAIAAMTALLLGGASAALAQDASTTTTTTGSTTPPVVTPAPMPPVMKKGEMKLEIGPKGRALIRGNVDSVGADYIMVKSWGGLWKVKVLGDTEILPKVTGGITDLAKYAVGDYVGAQGNVSATENWTIVATVVRSRTEHKEMKEERKQNEKDAHDIKKDDHKEGTGMKEDQKEARDTEARNFSGTVGSISGASFTLMNGSTSLSVTTSPTTKFVNRNWLTITLGDIAAADNVRVYGPVSSSTVLAQIVRDLSLPR